LTGRGRLLLCCSSVAECGQISEADSAMAQQQQQMPVERIQAFRTFATQLNSQVVEQLCAEYEREVACMWNDIVMYRNELSRVAELLGTQLTRERQLHGLVESLTNHHASIAGSSYAAVQNQPNADALHQMVDQLYGHVNATLQGVSQAHEVTRSHAMSAKGLEEPLISAEQEYTRIMQMLSQPAIPKVAPAPTTARDPQAAPQWSPPVAPAQPTARDPQAAPQWAPPMTPAQNAARDPQAAPQWAPPMTPTQNTRSVKVRAGSVASPAVPGMPPPLPPVAVASQTQPMPMQPSQGYVQRLSSNGSCFPMPPAVQAQPAVYQVAAY